jgi:hypothetical protein
MNRSEEEKKQIIPDQTRSGGWVDLACDGQATRSLVVALSGTVAGGLRLLRSCPGRDWICSGGHTGGRKTGSCLGWVIRRLAADRAPNTKNSQDGRTSLIDRSIAAVRLLGHKASVKEE